MQRALQLWLDVIRRLLSLQSNAYFGAGHHAPLPLPPTSSNGPIHSRESAHHEDSTPAATLLKPNRVSAKNCHRIQNARLVRSMVAVNEARSEILRG